MCPSLCPVFSLGIGGHNSTDPEPTDLLPSVYGAGGMEEISSPTMEEPVADTDLAENLTLESGPSPRKNPESEVESHDLESLYICRKSELLDLIKANSSHYFDAKSHTGAPVGLLNQGATCYLNCLLQALYSDVTFCSNLFLSDSTNHVVEQIRLLFASICLSEHATVSTKALTKVK